MSLDVSLVDLKAAKVSPTRIFLRENGATREVTREEWDARFPGTEPVSVTEKESDEVYWANITHNLGTMAKQAGIYEALWRPEEVGISKAEQLVAPLTTGLSLLRSDPWRFKRYNPENGWGNYDGFVKFVEGYLAACVGNPTADVRVSR